MGSIKYWMEDRRCGMDRILDGGLVGWNIGCRIGSVGWMEYWMEDWSCGIGDIVDGGLEVSG